MPGAITYAVEAAPRRAGLAAGVIVCALVALVANLGLHASSRSRVECSAAAAGQAFQTDLGTPDAL